MEFVNILIEFFGKELNDFVWRLSKKEVFENAGFDDKSSFKPLVTSSG